MTNQFGESAEDIWAEIALLKEQVSALRAKKTALLEHSIAQQAAAEFIKTQADFIKAQAVEVGALFDDVK